MAFLSVGPGGASIQERARQYQRLLGDQAAQYDVAANQASQRVLGDVASATQGTGNVLTAGRQAADASSQAQVGLAGQAAHAQAQVQSQALQMAREDQQRQSDQERQFFGGLLSGGGQLVGNVVGMMGGGPMGSQLGGSIGGAAGGLLGGGVSPQGTGGGNPLSQIPIVGGLLGGGQQPQQPMNPPALAGGTATPQGAGPVQQAPVPGATRRFGPDGQMHWFDVQGNIVG